MTAEELLVSVLTSDPELAQLVGKRVYDVYAPNIDPAAAYPYVVYSVVEHQHVKTLAGNSGTHYPRYQLDVVGLRSADVRAVVRRLFAVEGKRTESSGGVTLRWMWVENETDMAVYTTEQDDRAVRVASVDVILWYDDIGA